MKISINGKIVNPEEAFIPVFDRGYLFGEGLFETFRSYNGKIPFLDKHLGRMEWGATFINVPFPHGKHMQDWLEQLMKDTEFKDARLKIILTGMNEKTSKPQLPTDNMNINCVIFCEKFSALDEADYENGVELCLLKSIKNDPPPASNMKSTSWLTKLVARRELAEKDAFDGILLDALGYVTETTVGNLFWIAEEKIYTPPISLGLLPGITRGIILDLARESGYPVEERMIKPEDLLNAAEVFMTNSVHEVIPVRQIDNTPIGLGSAGAITKELIVAYKERIEEELND